MVTAVDRREKASQRRQVRQVADCATKSWATRLVLAPDVVDRLACDRDPTARFAGDLDHASRVRMGSAIVPIPGTFVRGSIPQAGPGE